MSGRSGRRARWTSSVDGDREVVAELERRMSRFYAEEEERRPYQEMLAAQEGAEPDPASVRHLLPRRVVELEPDRVLEVGCGDGRLFRRLTGLGFRGRYTGVEMSEELIAANRARHPDAGWQAASSYRLPFPDASFDCCFSLYVLEHLVYPRRGLDEMARVLRGGGRLLLVFPDFVRGGQLPSQQVGLSVGGTARDKLARGELLDALVSLYDSRLRLPRLLARAPERWGPFPVNLRPLCLEPGVEIAPDRDAVYIASKREVAAWGRERGFDVRFPAGTEGELDYQAFVELRKEPAA